MSGYILEHPKNSSDRFLHTFLSPVFPGFPKAAYSVGRLTPGCAPALVLSLSPYSCKKFLVRRTMTFRLPLRTVQGFGRELPSFATKGQYRSS